jgi:hypothetical protein
MRFLNQDALSVICAVQSLKAFALDDVEISHPADDWMKICEKYYNGIFSDIMISAGLRKNRDDLIMILDFKVTDEMRNTEYAQLGQFELGLDFVQEASSGVLRK